MIVEEKREFMQQYVLNRSITAHGGLDAFEAAKMAGEAWDIIEKECSKNKPQEIPEGKE